MRTQDVKIKHNTHESNVIPFEMYRLTIVYLTKSCSLNVCVKERMYSYRECVVQKHTYAPSLYTYKHTDANSHSHTQMDTVSM